MSKKSSAKTHFTKEQLKEFDYLYRGIEPLFCYFQDMTDGELTLVKRKRLMAQIGVSSESVPNLSYEVESKIPFPSKILVGINNDHFEIKVREQRVCTPKRLFATQRREVEFKDWEWLLFRCAQSELLIYLEEVLNCIQETITQLKRYGKFNEHGTQKIARPLVDFYKLANELDFPVRTILSREKRKTRQIRQILSLFCANADVTLSNSVLYTQLQIALSKDKEVVYPYGHMPDRHVKSLLIKLKGLQDRKLLGVKHLTFRS